jgi:hypothetical protein
MYFAAREATSLVVAVCATTAFCASKVVLDVERSSSVVQPVRRKNRRQLAAGLVRQHRVSVLHRPMRSDLHALDAAWGTADLAACFRTARLRAVYGVPVDGELIRLLGRGLRHAEDRYPCPHCRVIPHQYSISQQ